MARDPDPTPDNRNAAQAGRLRTAGGMQACPPGGGRILCSRDLLGPAREAVIEHDGEFYRLRRTAKGRLILTK